ncbi:MATE family Na+-driven efflux transporter [Tranquillimonas alkanivorans]|uniref:Na+-driven multidrug efflux pump n=1 Tax=Tranquillimonas alkanivorans TaxID=441119 RepID=A0A1I5TM22_9RHOB|nr:MATE family Na+-driven efflux transporter [Tranquillimonas alkanivorans]SFP84080.1 Na+-driven multidrug efflux pump [Tranquillimonas alkanivorans]
MSGLRNIDYRLWFAITLTTLLPTLYSTVRIYFLNSLPDTSNASIAAQSMWLNLSYEVVQEALLLPLYYIFGRVIGDRQALRERVGDALLVALIAYGILTIIILIGADWLTRAMSQQPALQVQTAGYLRLEAFGKMIGTLNDICVIVVVALSWERLLIALVALRTLLTVLLDSAFVGQFEVSLNLGIQGVAWTNISVGTLLLVPSVAILTRARVLGVPRLGRIVGWKKDWFLVAARSGLESGVRNLAFSLMILRLVNEVREAGLYWVTNGFIWGWLLLPVLSLGTLIRQDVGNHHGRLNGRLVGYLKIISLIIGVWIVTIPGWRWFILHAMGFDEAGRVVSLTVLLLAFYAAFAFNHVLDSYLYGMGRTDLILYQSLFVSVVYYGVAFVAYLTGIFIPDLRGIALLFGGGILVDSIVTLLQFWRTGYFGRSEASRVGAGNSNDPGATFLRAVD